MGVPTSSAPEWSASVGSGAERSSSVPSWLALPATGSEWLRFAGLVAQVAFLVVLCRGFNIENSAFTGRLLPLILFGFVANHLVAPAYRLSLFAALSVASIPLIFGWVEGAWLVALSLGLIGLCYLPLAWKWRATLVALAALTLVPLRMGAFAVPWPTSIWPVLGSMFMFRMIIYLYDTKHMGRQGLVPTLSYFFLLPNVVFPFFPVVDYHTFKRSHYAVDAYDTYQRGVHFMLRGLTHLVIYRLVYQFAVISPVEIQHTTDILRFVTANFMLYLRVSGIFHMVCGIFFLFGFHMPETHRFYFLPASFTDIWRRINIYWKDFLQKTVYMPVFFRTRRKLGETKALMLATALVIVATWFYHSYQWFWLLGHGLWSVTDALFWIILGIALVINVVLESRKGRTRVVGGIQSPTHAQAMRTAIRTTIIMVPLAVLWALWTSPTLDGFGRIFSALSFRPTDIAAVVASVAMVLAIAYGAQRLSLGVQGVGEGPKGWWANPLLTAGVPLVFAWGAGLPGISDRLPASVAGPLREMRVTELSRRDTQTLERGYYESLVGVSRFNAELWEVYSRQSQSDWRRLDDMGVERRFDDPIHAELRPNQGVVFHGASLRTNQWGMRDKEYAKAPAPGTYRLAMVGPSHAMGSGVEDDETFESLVESRLNRERAGAPSSKYEILNFAIEGFGLTQQRLLLERPRVWEFKPDAILLVAHPVEYFLMARYIVQEFERRSEPEDSAMRELALKAGVTKGMTDDQVQKAIKPFADPVIAREIKQIADLCAVHRVRCIYSLVPTPTWAASRAAGPPMVKAAQESGFTMLNLDDVFTGRDARELTVAPWDYHPNAKAHALIADRLFAELTARPELLTIAPPAPPVTAPTR